MADLEPEKRQVQVKGRIDVPDDFWDEMGLDTGDGTFVSCDGDSVTIVPADNDRLD